MRVIKEPLRKSKQISSRVVLYIKKALDVYSDEDRRIYKELALLKRKKDMFNIKIHCIVEREIVK